MMISVEMEKALNSLFDVMLMDEASPIDTSCHLIGLAMAVLARKVGSSNARDIITQSMDKIVASGIGIRLQ